MRLCPNPGGKRILVYLDPRERSALAANAVLFLFKEIYKLKQM